MKKIISTLLATIMIISCFASIPMTAQAATVTQTVKSFADFEQKINNNTISPTTINTSNTVEKDAYVCSFSISEDSYVLMKTVSTQNGSASLELQSFIYDFSLSKEYTNNKKIENYNNNKTILQNTKVLLPAGNYKILVNNYDSYDAKYYPENITTRVYLSVMDKNTENLTASYLGAISNNSQTIKLKINSLDKVESLYSLVANGSRNYDYSMLNTVGEKRELDENNCLEISLKSDSNSTLPSNTYPYVNIAVKDVYGFTHAVEYQILNDYTATVEGITNKTYTGKAITQNNFTVYAGYKSSTAPTYKVTYKNNLNVGTATMLIEGTDNTLGSITRTFKIYQASCSKHKYDSGKVTKAATFTSTGVKTYTCTVCKATKTETIPKISSVALSTYSCYYVGKVRTPSVTVKDTKGNTLKNGTDYTVSYQSGRTNVGRYAVTIKFKGKYSGSKTLYFNIIPKGTSLSKVTAKSKGFTVSWATQKTQTTGYQIQYSTSSKFSNAKTITMPKNTYSAKSISKLTGNKKYYVRVRTYRVTKFNGKNYNIYSPWSSAKSVTTKR